MQPSARVDALVGTVLEDAYRITRLIGQGGMGAVYEAVQLRLNKRVAIKLMARHLAADEKALARFHQEADITSHLGHPHLVSVIDFGQAATGEPYLVMEYLEGEDLDQRLGRLNGTPMPLKAVIRVVRQVASGLSAAHAKGVIHRDLKPANIFLVQIPGEPDFVKLLDFGISKMVAARTRLTNAASAVGTPAYMSPEQASGALALIDHHIDQWALACIAWELLAGMPPFVAEDSSALLYQIVQTEPRPLVPLLPDLPEALEVTLRRALSKQPARRFPSVRDFAYALEFAAFGRQPEVTWPPGLASEIVQGSPPLEEAIRQRLANAPSSVAPPSQQVGRLGNDWSGTGSPLQGARPVARQRWRHIRPLHAVVAVTTLLLLVGGFLVLRGRTPSASTDASHAHAPVVPLPALPAQPPPAPGPAKEDAVRTENVAPAASHRNVIRRGADKGKQRKSTSSPAQLQSHRKIIREL